jgi:hypothetical protein
MPDAHRFLEGQTFTLDSDASESIFYGDTFKNCRLILDGGKPLFLNCVFVDCEFDPAMQNGRLGAWEGHMHGSIIDTRKI